MLKQPGEQRCGGRFTVGAANNERSFAAQELVLEQLWQRAVVELVLKCILSLRIASGNGVANDDKVGLVREVGLVKRPNLDAAILKESGHWWVDALVGAGDRDATLLQCCGN